MNRMKKKRLEGLHFFEVVWLIGLHSPLVCGALPLVGGALPLVCGAILLVCGDEPITTCTRWSTE
jgi:hypothetical protein